MTVGARYQRLPTAAKLLLILTAVLLPIGLALAWMGETGIRQANSALKGRAEDQSRAAAQAMESLIARTALALRISANEALAEGSGGACERASQALSIAPGLAQSFELEDQQAKAICSVGTVGDMGTLAQLAPGKIAVRIAPSKDAVAVRVGVTGGAATAVIPASDLRAAAVDAPGDADSVVLHDGVGELRILDPPNADLRLRATEWPIGSGGLFARISARDVRISPRDRVLLLLPLLMWVAAAVITWSLVSRLLVRPLKRLEGAVRAYRPGEGELELPRKLGPSQEIQELRDAFGRAIHRATESDRETNSALEGQRKLVREVHHRVKNNLQVVASLLNIHGRNANTPDARAAYAGISRRVGALSVVHRNHFAEMEENRGISLRPLVAELAAELRASAPESARGVRIDLDLDSLYTTQDVAVAVAFLVTEIVEFAMLHAAHEPIEITLRRTSELTGRLELGCAILVPEAQDDPEKVQFERIVGGLAKQLRSTLDRRLGRYSVDLPVFPAA